MMAAMNSSFIICHTLNQVPRLALVIIVHPTPRRCAAIFSSKTAQSILAKICTLAKGDSAPARIAPNCKILFVF